MFITVYTTGNFLKCKDLEEAFSHPGEFWVINIEDAKNLHMYGFNRIPRKISIGFFTLEGCEKINDGFRFSFCDSRDSNLYRIDTKRAYIENCLSLLVKSLFEASKFPDWKTYDEFSKIDNYKKIIADLKERIQQLESEKKLD